MRTYAPAMVRQAGVVHSLYGVRFRSAASFASTGLAAASSVREVEFDPEPDVGCSMEITSSVLCQSIEDKVRTR